MKISPITNYNQNFGINFLKKKQQNAANPITSRNSFETNLTGYDAYEYINSLEDVNKSKRPNSEQRKKLEEIKELYTTESTKIENNAYELAILSHSPYVESWHLNLAALIRLKQFLADVQEGNIDPYDETLYDTVKSFPYMIHQNCALWDDPELMQESAKVIDEQIDYLMKEYFQKALEEHPRKRLTRPVIASDTIEDMAKIYSVLNEETKNDQYMDNYFLALPTFSQNKKLQNSFIEFCKKLQTLGKTEKIDNHDKYHIEFYDHKADSIWKNIALGNNVLVLRDSDNLDGYSNLKSSFVNLLNKPEQKYGMLEPSNTDILLLNENAQVDFIDNYYRSTLLDKSKKDRSLIVVGDLDSIIKNSGGKIDPDFFTIMSGTKKENKNQANIRYVFSISPEVYHRINQLSPEFSKILSQYAQQTLPILNATDAKEYLTNESGLKFVEAKIGKLIAKDAIEKSIELTSSKSGNYPQKALNLLDSVAKYFVDEKEITSNHVETYLKETESLSEVSDTDERNIIFDTGKTLDDIKGMPMVLADAKALVRQIKNRSIGTRGYLIYHSHGSAYGGGRRHTAEAIAGEAQIPMVTINARDFALKDIDALSQEAGLSELKIKKIMQTVKSLAEANKLSTVMIYIDNFDNFASDPNYGISSIYEQKAFSQLLAEMDTIRKEGKINLVVMGSSNIPQIIDENIQKPYKFLNQIVVYQPQDTNQRREIIDYYVDKNNYQIAPDREKTLQSISESTEGFSVVDLMYILENAQMISKEREKTQIDNSDLVESLLQATSGRTNTRIMTDTSKMVTTAHETGHALTSVVMYDFMKNQDTPWNLPYKVDYMTLDPRGNYGGAVMYKDSENLEVSFERILSEIVSCYGGYSSENSFFGMRGSLGITQDMKMAQEYAYEAVTKMGMGKRTGVRHIDDTNILSEKQKDNVAQDIDDILRTGKLISDLIVEEYKDFIEEFSKRHYQQVATGDCIISAEQFRKELNEWLDENPSSKQKVTSLNIKIRSEIEKCKMGRV